MKVTKSDFITGMMGGLICFGVLFNIPVWAIFIGWGWYTVLGGHVGIFKEAFPAMIVGYILSAISIIAYTASSENIFVLVITVGITVFIQTLILKREPFSCEIASFNAYSCLFAIHSTQSFPVSSSYMIWDINNVMIALLWTHLQTL